MNSCMIVSSKQSRLMAAGNKNHGSKEKIRAEEEGSCEKESR